MGIHGGVSVVLCLPLGGALVLKARDMWNAKKGSLTMYFTFEQAEVSPSVCGAVNRLQGLEWPGPSPQGHLHLGLAHAPHLKLSFDTLFLSRPRPRQDSRI